MTFRSRLLCGALALGAMGVGSTAIAATATDTATTEAAAAPEVSGMVITARKRSENIQRVPLSVSAQTGQQLQQQHITQPTDLMRLFPSMQSNQSSGSDNSAQFGLRGQYAADSLLGVSQPVGLYEDTVNVPHPFGANGGFVDIARVEVLNGPQGTLYGRNTTGGAINIITRDADYSGYHGYLEGEVGDYGDWKATGALNATLIQDVLAVRVAFQHWSRYGFGRSLVNNQRLGDDHNDNTVRVSIKWNPLSNLRGNFKMEYGDAHHTGPMLANVSILPPVLANSTNFPSGLANFGSRIGFVTTASDSAYLSTAMTLSPANVAAYGAAVGAGDINGINNLIAQGQAALAPCIGRSYYTNCSATAQFDNLTTWHGVIDLSWDITPDINLRSISGAHSFQNFKVFDLDSIQPQVLEVGYGSAASGGLAMTPAIPGTPALPFPLKPDQESLQFSQELDLTGKHLFGMVDWLVGGFVSMDRGKGVQQAGAIDETLGALGIAPPMFAHDGLSNTSSSWAIFTQNDIHITDKLSITAGGRYTSEHITQILANWDYNIFTGAFTCEGGVLVGSPPVPITNKGLPLPVAGQKDSCGYVNVTTGPAAGQGSALAWNGVSFNNATFTGWSYLFSLNYQVTPDIFVYAKTSRGFRGGAFGRANGPAALPETDTDYELGFKSQWFDHRLRFNVALYQTDYSNKQVSSQICNDGSTPPCGAIGFTTVVRNAATARIRGVELQGDAHPFEGMSIYGELSYIDAKYTDWPNAVSYEGIPLNTLGIPSGNAKGLALAVSPTWQGSIGGRYEHPFGPGVASIQLDYQYIGSLYFNALNNQFFVPDSIEQQIQGAVGLLNGRLEYKFTDMNLSLAIWCTNCTNVVWGREGISAAYTGGIGHVVVQPPRMFGFTIRKAFGPGE
jgi:iron complex outermembrane receptor protein